MKNKTELIEHGYKTKQLINIYEVVAVVGVLWRRKILPFGLLHWRTWLTRATTAATAHIKSPGFEGRSVGSGGKDGNL